LRARPDRVAEATRSERCRGGGCRLVSLLPRCRNTSARVRPLGLCPEDCRFEGFLPEWVPFGGCPRAGAVWSRPRFGAEAPGLGSGRMAGALWVRPGRVAEATRSGRRRGGGCRLVSPSLRCRSTWARVRPHGGCPLDGGWSFAALEQVALSLGRGSIRSAYEVPDFEHKALGPAIAW
jgi:hypothetical protein